MLRRDFNVVIILFFAAKPWLTQFFFYSLIHAWRGSSKKKIIVILQLMHYTQMILYNTVKPSTEGKMLNRLEGHLNSHLIISTYLCTYENTSWPKGTESRPLSQSHFSKTGYYDRQRPSRRPRSSVTAHFFLISSIYWSLLSSGWCCNCGYFSI